MDTIGDLFNGYSKPEGNADLRESLAQLADVDGVDTIKSEVDSTPGEYKKGTGTISSFLIIVVSGGEVRESNYLQELSKKSTFPRIKLIFVSSEKNKGGLSPKMMVDKLGDRVEFGEPLKSDKILYSTIDKIFMVSDVDHYYEELAKILSTHTDPKIVWIISNPCFEMWLYYAHFDYLRNELEVLASIPQSQQSSTLKTINDSIVKGGIDPRKAFERIKFANINSRNNYHADENGIPKLYCTNMYILGEYLLAVIGEQEFEKWLDEKQKKIEAYSKKVL